MYSGILWSFGALLSALLLLKGFSNISGMKRESYHSSNPSCTDLLAELERKVGIRRHTELLLHDSLFSPLSFGFWKPVVILPAEADGWSEERLNIVLLHELLHIRKRDYVLNLFIRTVCVVFWFNPLIWIAVKRYRLIQESACDDGMIEMRVSPYAYAKELLELTFCYQHLTPKFSLSSNLWGKSDTEKRITEILATRKISQKKKRQHISIFIMLILILSMLFSLVSFVGASDVASLGDIPDLWPVRDGAGSPSAFFHGIDITCPDTMYIVASANGEVTTTGTNSVLIHHKNGVDTFYGNMCVVSVTAGQTVAKGDTIGICYSGLIHFEMIKDDTSIDPMSKIKKAIL